MASTRLDNKITVWAVLIQFNVIIFAILLELGLYSAIMAFILLVFNIHIKVLLNREFNQ